MPAPPIAIYGAIDRFNYGDLLFPLVLDSAFRTAGCDRPIIPVGVRSSDLSRYGALPTKPMRWLAEPDNLPNGSKVVIAGGEALAAGWGRMVSHLMPQRMGDPIYALASRLLSPQTLDRLGKKLAHASWDHPFCPRPGDFAHRVDTIFNAVGGSGLPNLPPDEIRVISDAVAQAVYASVRDRATHAALGAESSGVEVHPDSAAVMAQLYPADKLLSEARADVRAIIDDPRPFVCFQLHRYFTPEKLQRFARELDRISHDGGLRIVLLPIGRAAGHSDQVSLSKVKTAMKEDAEMPAEMGVFDIMALLAHCAIYTGTSLHGLITAMAFGRPYAALGKNSKCLAFLDAWAPVAFQGTARAKGFAETVSDRIAQPHHILLESADEIYKAAATGLGRVVDVALN